MMTINIKLWRVCQAGRRLHQSGGLSNLLRGTITRPDGGEDLKSCCVRLINDGGYSLSPKAFSLELKLHHISQFSLLGSPWKEATQSNHLARVIFDRTHTKSARSLLG